ncbi:hypothetical protein N657DRAFT_606561 [Parathielavia appendiculata]|uniref:Zn(2)-C6 fungal-type domain-containing protein n=1 Tax=Parathielavia appendiculata TaxID=2587402 RepID=A0AAN6TQB4_9PEZI|nr:hypothetical protein N657DRAFT_606561 [Parathielavia appendiculata]
MGRQPTSGYCQTCRKRRIKCDCYLIDKHADKTRPRCGQCSASGHRCGGYRLPLRMEVYGVHSDNNGAQKLVRLSTASLKRLTPSSGPTVEIRLNYPYSREELSPAYFFTTYNWAPFFRPLLLSATNGDFPEINKVCLQAISYGYAGLSLGDGTLQNKGRLLYGRVLSEVRSLLQQPVKPLLARLGFTMIMMGIYEFTVNKLCGQAPPHHVGLMQILHHCGSETFREQPLLEVYRSCRAMLICQALGRQSRCFLEDIPWKTVPWRHAPRTFEDCLMDIMVHLPGIAETLAVPQNRASCLDKIKTLSVALQDWRWAWHAANSASVRQVRHAASLDDADSHLRPDTPILVRHMLQTSLEFDTPRQALDILYYNVALIYLMQLEAAARGQTYPYSEVLSPAEQRYIRRQVAAASHQSSDGGGSPLLLPGQARFRCQAAAEAFMTLSCATRLLATTSSMVTVVTPMPIGIMYWVLRDQMQLREEEVALLVSRFPVLQDAESVFPGCFVSVGVGNA